MWILGVRQRCFVPFHRQVTKVPCCASGREARAELRPRLSKSPEEVPGVRCVAPRVCLVEHALGLHTCVNKRGWLLERPEDVPDERRIRPRIYSAQLALGRPHSCAESCEWLPHSHICLTPDRLACKSLLSAERPARLSRRTAEQPTADALCALGWQLRTASDHEATSPFATTADMSGAAAQLHEGLLLVEGLLRQGGCPAELLADSLGGSDSQQGSASTGETLLRADDSAAADEADVELHEVPGGLYNGGWEGFDAPPETHALHALRNCVAPTAQLHGEHDEVSPEVAQTLTELFTWHALGACRGAAAEQRGVHDFTALSEPHNANTSGACAEHAAAQRAADGDPVVLQEPDILNKRGTNAGTLEALCRADAVLDTPLTLTPNPNPMEPRTVNELGASSRHAATLHGADRVLLTLPAPRTENELGASAGPAGALHGAGRALEARPELCAAGEPGVKADSAEERRAWLNADGTRGRVWARAVSPAPADLAASAQQTEQAAPVEHAARMERAGPAAECIRVLPFQLPKAHPMQSVVSCEILVLKVTLYTFAVQTDSAKVIRIQLQVHSPCHGIPNITVFMTGPARGML